MYDLLLEGGNKRGVAAIATLKRDALETVKGA